MKNRDANPLPMMVICFFMSIPFQIVENQEWWLGGGSVSSLVMLKDVMPNEQAIIPGDAHLYMPATGNRQPLGFFDSFRMQANFSLILQVGQQSGHARRAHGKRGGQSLRVQAAAALLNKL